MKIKVRCIDRTASERYSFLASKEVFTVIGFKRLQDGRPAFHIEGDPTRFGFSVNRFVPSEEITEVIIEIPKDLKYIDI